MAHTDVLQAKRNEDVDKGLVRRRRGMPWPVPAGARRTSVIPKGAAVDGAPQPWRCAVGRSDGALVWVFGRVREMPAAPSVNTEKRELPELRWTLLQSVMEGGTCVADATRLVGGGRVRRDLRREGLVSAASRVRDGAVGRRTRWGASGWRTCACRWMAWRRRRSHTAWAC